MKAIAHERYDAFSTNRRTAEAIEADAEDLRQIARGVGFIHAAGPARQNDPAGIHIFEFSNGNSRADQLTVNARFAHPPGDQLCVLGSKIQNWNDFIMSHLDLIPSRVR